jgi:CubicO group peptidase (beta-lactamase class C family)
VHDEAAAMLNGISCNAGLFGNAHDLGKLFMMYMNDGKYNDKQIIPANAIKEFTRYQYPENKNRRGLGFDKPLLEYIPEDSYVAESASPSSFGHSGFTGTFVWADPEHDILLVFLSNRVYPTRENRKLYSLDLRPRLHQAIYNALLLDGDDN